MSTLAHHVARNTLAQIIGKIISLLLGLVTIGLMTRYLGQVGFGQYTTVINYLSFFAVAADLGLTLITSQLLSQPGANEKNILGNLMALRLVSALAILLPAPIIIWFLPYEPIIKLGAVIAVFSFVFPALSQVLIGFFQKQLRVDRVAIAEVVSRIFLLIFVIITIYGKLGLYGILAAHVASAAAAFIIQFYYASQTTTITLRFQFTWWREVIRRSWPLGITIVFNLIYLRADTLILSLIKTQGEVGLYGAAYRVVDVLITIPFIFAGILLPIMTRTWLTDRLHFPELLQRAADIMAMVAVPMAIGTQFIATDVMHTVAGQEFITSGVILRILIIAVAIIYVGTIYSHAVIALEQQRRIIPAYIFTAITAVIGYLIFIPRYGYLGAAWVTVYSELTIACCSYWLVRKHSAIRFHSPIIFQILFSTALLSVILWLSPFYWWFNLPVAIVIYFLSLWQTGGIKTADLLLLIRKTKTNE
ncbi:MAG: flippase [Candidatus Falkowbacteria bacterium]